MAYVRWMGIAGVLVVPSILWGQSSDATTKPAETRPAIQVAPPSIEFPNWQLVFRTEGSIEYVVSYPSPIVTTYPANNLIQLRVFVPDDGATSYPSVIVLHYWGARDLRVERTLAAELNRRGIIAAVMTLPYHLSRTPAGTRSGQLAIQPDVDRLKSTMTQAVLDTRRSIDFLLTRPEVKPGKVGLVGTSLGALVASTVYGVDPRVTDVAFLLGGVDLAGILWNSSRVVSQRDGLRRRGYTEERMREVLQEVEPARYLPRKEPGHAFVIGGLYDTVVPRRNTEALISLMPEPKTLWLGTGHYGGIFVQRRLMREVSRFFSAEFAGTTFVPPVKLYAPTFRIGFGVATDSGLDLSAGIDLWRFDPKGNSFASLLATPRGLHLFLGRHVSAGLSIGGFGSNRGIGFGILWSTVL